MKKEEAIKFGNLIIKIASQCDDEESKHTVEFTELAVKAIENQKSLQSEFEEIKKKIENYNKYYLMEDDYSDGVRYGLYLGCQELEKAINKADCDNDCEHCTWIECPKEGDEND